MPKVYSEDFRHLVVKKFLGGMSRGEVLSFFDIGYDTLTRWVKQYKEAGDLSPKICHRYRSKKVSDDALLAYVKKYSDATLEEIAGHFNVSIGLVFYRLKKLGITRKKNHAIRGAG